MKRQELTRILITLMFAMSFVFFTVKQVYSQVTVATMDIAPPAVMGDLCPSVIYQYQAKQNGTATFVLPCTPVAGSVKAVSRWEVVGGKVQDPVSGAWVSSTTKVFNAQNSSVNVKWELGAVHTLKHTSIFQYECSAGFPIINEIQNQTLSFNLKAGIPLTSSTIGAISWIGHEAGLACFGEEIELASSVSNTASANIYNFKWICHNMAGFFEVTNTVNDASGSTRAKVILNESSFNPSSNTAYFRVALSYLACPESGTIVESFSSTMRFNRTPTVNITKSPGLCDKAAEIQINGNTEGTPDVEVGLFKGFIDPNTGQWTSSSGPPTSFLLAVTGTNFSSSAVSVDPGPENAMHVYKLQVTNTTTKCRADQVIGTFPKTINVITLPTPIIQNEICHDPLANTGSISLSPGGAGITPPFTYKLSTMATPQTSMTVPHVFNNLAGGTSYDVEIKDANGCTTATPVVTGLAISEPAPINFSLTGVTDVSCKSPDQGNAANGTIKLTATGGTGAGFTYSVNSLIDFRDNNGNITGVSAGAHVVRVKDKSLGCVKEYPSPVNVAAPAAALSYGNVEKNDIKCSGNTTTAGRIELKDPAGGTGAYSYSLNNINFQTSPLFKPVAAGSHFVYIKDAKNCVLKSESIAIQSETLSVTKEQSTDLICANGKNGSATIKVLGGQQPYTITWPDGQTGLTATNLGAGNHTVSVKDANGCVGSEQISLSAPPPLKALFDYRLPSCVGNEDGYISAQASGGAGNYSYSWGADKNVPLLYLVGAGSYHLVVKDQNECALDTTFVLESPATADLGPDKIVCTGEPIKLTGNIPGFYKWTSDKGFSSTAQEIAIKEPGLYQLELRDLKGCISKDEIRIDVANDLLKSNFLMVPEAYAGDSVIIIDISWPLPTNISWNFGAEADVLYNGQDWAVVKFKEEGVYTIGMTAQLGGCSDSREQLIKIIEKEESAEGGRIVTSVFKNVMIYPNPNNGQFSVGIELNESLPVSVEIMSLNSNRPILTEQLSGSNRYIQNYKLLNLAKGIYFVFIKAGSDTKMIRLVAF